MAAAARTVVHVTRTTGLAAANIESERHLQGRDFSRRRFGSTGEVLELTQVRRRGVKSRYLLHDLHDPAKLLNICT